MSINRMKENGLGLKKASNRYPIETITDVDYADDLALLIARSIGRYVNSVHVF